MVEEKACGKSSRETERKETERIRGLPRACASLAPGNGRGALCACACSREKGRYTRNEGSDRRVEFLEVVSRNIGGGENDHSALEKRGKRMKPSLVCLFVAALAALASVASASDSTSHVAPSVDPDLNWLTPQEFKVRRERTALLSPSSELPFLFSFACQKRSLLSLRRRTILARGHFEIDVVSSLP